MFRPISTIGRRISFEAHFKQFVRNKVVQPASILKQVEKIKLYNKENKQLFGPLLETNKQRKRNLKAGKCIFMVSAFILSRLHWINTYLPSSLLLSKIVSRFNVLHDVDLQSNHYNAIAPGFKLFTLCLLSLSIIRDSSACFASCQLKSYDISHLTPQYTRRNNYLSILQLKINLIKTLAPLLPPETFQNTSTRLMQWHLACPDILLLLCCVVKLGRKCCKKQGNVSILLVCCWIILLWGAYKLRQFKMQWVVQLPSRGMPVKTRYCRLSSIVMTSLSSILRWRWYWIKPWQKTHGLP